MKKTSLLVLGICVFLLISGFDLDNAIVPKDLIMSGGPPKGGIPAILEPKFIPAEEQEF